MYSGYVYTCSIWCDVMLKGYQVQGRVRGSIAG